MSKLALGEGEEAEVIEKIENSCIKFDHDKKGVNNKFYPIREAFYIAYKNDVILAYHWSIKIILACHW